MDIDRLDREIDDALARLEIPTPQVACATTNTCARATPMAATPPVAPACTRSSNETCTDVCTIADAICTNADRICTLATELGGDDAYANEKCEKGRASCDAARTRCCGCT